MHTTKPRSPETTKPAPGCPDTYGEEAPQAEKSEAGEDDENETCGFCIFMKGGGCKDAFTVSKGGDFAPPSPLPSAVTAMLTTSQAASGGPKLP